MTELEVIEACKQNDRLAQRTLYDGYKRAMYTLAYRITGSFEEADDVFQEAFVDVFKNLEGFRGESTVGAWIKTIVIRKAYAKLKKKVVFENLENITEVNLNLAEESLDAEHLEKAILGLPEGFRTVFVMIEIEGYTHKEVAQILGITDGTSKSQLFYAKKRLKSILENEK